MAAIILCFLEINLALGYAKFTRTHTHAMNHFFSGTFIMFTDVIFPHKKKNNPIMTVSVFKLASEKKKNPNKQSDKNICSNERG